MSPDPDPKAPNTNAPPAGGPPSNPPKDDKPKAQPKAKDERPRVLFLAAGSRKGVRAAVNERSRADANVVALEILEGDRAGELEDSVVKWSGKGDQPNHHVWMGEDDD